MTTETKTRRKSVLEQAIEETGAEPRVLAPNGSAERVLGDVEASVACADGEHEKCEMPGCACNCHGEISVTTYDAKGEAVDAPVSKRGRKGKAQDDPQLNMFDRTIEDEALESACARYLETQPAARSHGKARKTLYELLNGLNLKDGERVRIGRFVVPGKKRKGGGFSVEPWEKTGIGTIAEIG